jgi:uncharacterized protein YjlB
MESPEAHVFVDDGRFPNSALPVLVYRAVVSDAADRASRFERLFSTHLWPAAWRNGLYSRHHYHSTAHEVLGVYEGWVKARLGGERGGLLTLHAGDVLVIPAGVAHCNEGQSRDFRVVGAYPRGTDMDMNYGEAGDRPAADRRIATVPAPERDPVFGAGGPLVALWRT